MYRSWNSVSMRERIDCALLCLKALSFVVYFKWLQNVPFGGKWNFKLSHLSASCCVEGSKIKLVICVCLWRHQIWLVMCSNFNPLNTNKWNMFNIFLNYIQSIPKMYSIQCWNIYSIQCQNIYLIFLKFLNAITSDSPRRNTTILFNLQYMFELNIYSIQCQNIYSIQCQNIYSIQCWNIYSIQCQNIYSIQYQNIKVRVYSIYKPDDEGVASQQ